MKIIISPAKKMRVDLDSLAFRDFPVFLNLTGEIADILRNQSDDELKKLWKCNDDIAALNIHRLKTMDLERNLTPAILSYEGIQYQYMAPNVFSDLELEYIQEHLRILSGFYGILKPFDGVTPYRLEMQAKLRVGKARNLYDYWGEQVATHLFDKTECVVNLASKEYSTCVSNRIPNNLRFITCIFGEIKDGRVVEKGTMCKMARGEMVRFMAEKQILDPEEIKTFDRLNYQFCPDISDDKTFVFLK